MEVVDCHMERLMSPTSYYSEVGAGTYTVCPLWLKYVRFHQLRLPPGRVYRWLHVTPGEDGLERSRRVSPERQP